VPHMLIEVFEGPWYGLWMDQMWNLHVVW